MDYSSFGQVIQDTNPGFQPFGFAGGLYDAAIGSIRFGARDYLPTLARWASKDPILFHSGQTNLYIYAFGDPVNYADLDGQIGLLLGGRKDLSARQNLAISRMTSQSGRVASSVLASGIVAGTGGLVGRASVGLLCKAAKNVDRKKLAELIDLGMGVAEALALLSGNPPTNKEKIHKLGEHHNQETTKITEKAKEPATKSYIRQIIRKARTFR